MATIHPTEDDASPETRFIRRVQPGSVPLPNERWFRSPKLQEHAICLDPHHTHYGWLMVEGWADNWVPCRRLTTDEMRDLVAMAKQQVQQLKEQLNGR